MSKTTHFLDHNKLYSLTLDYDPGKQQLKVSFDDNGAASPRFVKNIMRQLNLEPEQGHPGYEPRQRGNSITFQHVSRHFTVCLSDEPIAMYQIDLHGNLSANYQRPLIVDETRRIGSFHECPPYPRHREGLTQEENRALVRTAKQAVFTDIHTHSSGQISAMGLLEVAMQKRPYYYPTALLAEAGINTSYQDIPQKYRKSIPRVPFPPMDKANITYPAEVEGCDLHHLNPDDLKKLAAQMTLPADRQSTFTHLEYQGNRFRYPFSKDPSLTAAIRIKEAEEYAAQGVTFALSAYVGLDKPGILKVIHDTVEKLQSDKRTQGFSQRYMAGVPRGLPASKIEETLEKTKILLDSPYVMGLDMLGYESNKTKEFIDMLDHYAAWANEHKPGSYIRVHAGENDKNHDNVKDFLKIAVKYPNLHYLVGHGVYGMDRETIKLLKQLGNRVTVELNPASNIALNNIDDVRQLPFDRLQQHRIPFIIGSDCAGMYQTDAVQLGLSAYNAGLDAAGFETLRQNQLRIVEHMQEYSRSVMAGIPNWETAEGKAAHLLHIDQRISEVPPAIVPKEPEISQDTINAKLRADQVKMIEPSERVPEFDKKFPVTIIGASGESWKRLSKGQQRQSAIAIDMLIHALGDNCYIVQGRNKKVGLSKVINQSLRGSNDERRQDGRAELYNVGLLVDPSFDDTISYKHLSHMVHLPGQTLDLARSIIDHTFAHDGAIIAVGGAAYTRDTILEADQRDILDNHPDNRKMMLLLSNAAGASSEKASVLNPHYGADDGMQLVKKLFSQRPELFPKGFNTRTLNQLHEAATRRVATYGYNVADSSLVTGPVEQISRTPVTVTEAQTERLRRTGNDSGNKTR